MRKTLVILLAIALITGVLALAGCGDKSETSENATDGEKTVNVDRPLSESIIGVYVEGVEPGSTTGQSLAINKGGEWEGSAWGSEKRGTYTVEEEPTKAITFTFEDGATEAWSVMMADGEVAAIVNPKGVQFTKYKK